MKLINRLTIKLVAARNMIKVEPPLHIFSVVICIVSIIILASNLIANIDRPLWYEESWRAYAVSSDFEISESDKYSTAIAPVTIGYYLFTKVATTIYDFEFTQNLLTYISSVLLLAFLYMFGKEAKGKYFGFFLVGVIGVTVYFLEYSTSNKPFITDSFFTVALLYATYLYVKGRIKILTWFGLALISAISSFAAFFVIGSCLLFMLSCAIKRKKYPISEILVGILLAVVMSAYYFYFVMPQYNDGLHEWWKDLLATGDLYTSIKMVGMNFLSMFGIRFDELLNVQGYYNGGVLPYISWVGSSDQLSQLLGSFYLITFFISSIYIVYKRNYLLAITVFTIFLILGEQLIAYCLGIWPFGGNRVNIFLYVLIAIVICWGIYSYLESKKKVDIGLVTAVFILIFLFLPLRSIARVTLLERGEDYFYLNTREVALDLRRDSAPGEKILVYHRLAKLPFKYYFCFNDNTSADCDTREVFYSPYIEEGEFSKDFFESQNSDILWVYLGYGSTEEAIINSQSHYNVVSSKNYVMTGTVYKLTRKEQPK